MNQQLRNIPSVSSIISDGNIIELSSELSPTVLNQITKDYLDKLRSSLIEKKLTITQQQIVDDIIIIAKKKYQKWPSKVLNGTGVILHTNLGRAPLSVDALQAIDLVSQGYSNLELNLDNGKRGSRQYSVTALLKELTGAEDAFVVNNTAAALLLCLTSTSNGGEVIVSRSEEIEIGGGFRIPDVLSQSGSKLIEVGTTNKTYKEDYANAVTGSTKAILSMHASNYKIIGFTHKPSISELCEVAKTKNLTFIHDVGSGCLLDISKYNLPNEPKPQDSISAGVDLCLFSGDKLLGGPQSGIIVGKKELISKISKHPLARAIRIDKINLAALHATLMHYIKGEAENNIPIWKMISSSTETLRTRGLNILRNIGIDLGLVVTQSSIGGGSLPSETLPSIAIEINSCNVEIVSSNLRNAHYPVLARIYKDKILIDLRTISSGEDKYLEITLKEVLTKSNN